MGHYVGMVPCSYNGCTVGEWHGWQGDAWPKYGGLSNWEALEVMLLCAEWRASKTSFLREGGMSTLSL